MKLIVGLGNPGEKYENTRHNIGAQVVNEFAKNYDFPKFKLQKKYKSLVTKSKLEEQDIMLAIPQTYMNNSGAAVQLLVAGLSPYGGSPEGRQATDLIVIHDELDLKFGRIKIKKDGSSAGHNGIKSILENLSDENFVRLRLGIANEHREYVPAEKFVLQKFSKEEQKKLAKETIPRAVMALELALSKGVAAAMNEYN